MNGVEKKKGTLKDGTDEQKRRRNSREHVCGRHVVSMRRQWLLRRREREGTSGGNQCRQMEVIAVERCAYSDSRVAEEV